MSLWNGIEMYGRKMTVCSRQYPQPRKIRAFLQPINPQDYQSSSRAGPPGYFDKRTYLFIAAPYALKEEESDVIIVCGGVEYEMLRAEIMMLGDEKTHWEGVLRPIGRVDEDV